MIRGVPRKRVKRMREISSRPSIGRVTTTATRIIFLQIFIRCVVSPCICLHPFKFGPNQTKATQRNTT